MSNIEGYRVTFFITSEKTVDKMKILGQSGIVQETFDTLKEGQQCIERLMRVAEKDNLFIHYNFEEIQSVLLESRGKITRDNKIKESVNKMENQ